MIEDDCQILTQNAPNSPANALTLTSAWYARMAWWQ